MKDLSTQKAKVLQSISSNRKRRSFSRTTPPNADTVPGDATGRESGSDGSGRVKSSSRRFGTPATTGAQVMTGKAKHSALSRRPLPLRPRVQVSDRAMGTEQAALMLARLTFHDRSRADWPEARWQMMWEDYLQVLANYPVHELDLGIQHWLLEGKPFFPSIAELMEAMRQGVRRWLY